ncbi:DNA polymerase III [Deinococcus maricopensis]|uniref:DNA polymerase III subunit, putative n=1 Tax=Deinococcus maricopensis (strain DSM 21211 / LMG 22137 / NRRL B-23946 / LB-34) TaxID=709986 RepID=E8U3Y6_DEIML|nr:DNA polymerase III [Deinococcus maricopensis]ADV65680.1 DNA polymerase III subunit, putative [Deinococcus maricopensis DSM 21211]
MTALPSPTGLIGHAHLLPDLLAYRGNALLLAGPARVGKRPLALTLAAALNCAAPTPGPCGVCPSCRALGAGQHPDVLIVEPRATTSTGRAARRKLIPIGAIQADKDTDHEFEGHVLEFAEVRATFARRVVVFDGAEFLGDTAANALLKLVEEPPHSTLFVFLTEDVAAVLPTIASRAARVNVTPVPDADLARALALMGEAADAELLGFAAGRPGVIVQRAAARAAMEDARTFTDALHAGMLEALEGAEGLEKRFDPVWHPEVLRFAWRAEEPFARARADAALEHALGALERYVSPALTFQVLALELRAALGEAS